MTNEDTMATQAVPDPTWQTELADAADGLLGLGAVTEPVNTLEGFAHVYPSNNPKAAAGAKKLPVQYVPPALMLGAAEAMADGGKKYGPYNFRESQIAADVYMGALMRHIFAWWDGEDTAEDSGVHHIKHVAACAGLILDAMECGTFDDNRPPKSGASKMIKEWNDEDL